MRDIFFIQPRQLDGGITDATETFQMDQDSFRALHERTAKPLWVYLWRKTGDAHLADDLLQETYYRFLRARAVFESDDHRKNYLYRIAANLANDAYRRGTCQEPLSEAHEATIPADAEI